MNKRLISIISLLVTLLPASAFTNSALAAGYVGLENRYTYTRWYEYPGTYYEEEFVLNGVQGGYIFSTMDASPVTIHYGIQGTVHPLAWYTSWPDDAESAMGISAGFFSHLDYSVNRDLALAARAGVNYLAAIGFGGENVYHEETFGSYLPTIDLGIGVRFKGVKLMGADALSIFYNFSVVDLGVSTDNWYSADPGSVDWDNYSFSVSLDFGF